MSPSSCHSGWTMAEGLGSCGKLEFPHSPAAFRAASTAWNAHTGQAPDIGIIPKTQDTVPHPLNLEWNLPQTRWSNVSLSRQKHRLSLSVCQQCWEVRLSGLSLPGFKSSLSNPCCGVTLGMKANTSVLSFSMCALASQAVRRWGYTRLLGKYDMTGEQSREGWHPT